MFVSMSTLSLMERLAVERVIGCFGVESVSHERNRIMHRLMVPILGTCQTFNLARQQATERSRPSGGQDPSLPDCLATKPNRDVLLVVCLWHRVVLSRAIRATRHFSLLQVGRW